MAWLCPFACRGEKLRLDAGAGFTIVVTFFVLFISFFVLFISFLFFVFCFLFFVFCLNRI